MEPFQAQAHQRNRFQAASRRGAKSRRLALAFKARSFSGLAFVSHWLNCFQPFFVRGRMSRQRSAIWQTTCSVLVFIVASFSVWGALCIFQPWCVIGTLLDDTEAASEVFISFWSSPSAVSSSHFPRTAAAPFPRICCWGLLSLCSSLCVYVFSARFGWLLCLSYFPGLRPVSDLEFSQARCDDSDNFGSLADQFPGHSCWRGVQPRPHNVKLSSGF